jgi:hypothetical protein
LAQPPPPPPPPPHAPPPREHSAAFFVPGSLQFAPLIFFGIASLGWVGLGRFFGPGFWPGLAQLPDFLVWSNPVAWFLVWSNRVAWFCFFLVGLTQLPDFLSGLTQLPVFGLASGVWSSPASCLLLSLGGGGAISRLLFLGQSVECFSWGQSVEHLLGSISQLNARSAS